MLHINKNEWTIYNNIDTSLNIIGSKTSQIQKSTYYNFPFVSFQQYKLFYAVINQLSLKKNGVSGEQEGGFWGVVIVIFLGLDGEYI